MGTPPTGPPNRIPDPFIQWRTEEFRRPEGKMNLGALREW